MSYRLRMRATPFLVIGLPCHAAQGDSSISMSAEATVDDGSLSVFSASKMARKSASSRTPCDSSSGCLPARERDRRHGGRLYPGVDGRGHAVASTATAIVARALA
jgi:hypothetical protein